TPKERPLAEALRKFGLIERADGAGATSFYYGTNVSRGGEPLDQLDALLLLSRMRKSGLDGRLTLFVAGRYSQLNGAPLAELLAAEERKMRAMRAAASALSLPLAILRTDELWYDPGYWSAVSELSTVPGIISGRSGARFSDVASSFEPAILSAMPEGLMGALGQIEAPALYRLFEVAEASALSRRMGIGCKIGPASEEEYDWFIGSFMGIIQLRQPLDFRSSPASPRPLLPYISKSGQERIFLDDGKEELAGKIFGLAQRSSGSPLFYGGFMNPFARAAALAVEAAAAADSLPVRFGNSLVRDGEGAIRVLDRGGTSGLTRLAPVVAECLWAYLLKPVQAALEGGAAA
ncbi:MAG: hypothetical protein AB1529_07115, partial [Candidatus Micrarchaeota archaeon]